MRIVNLYINNFRGIKSANLMFPKHGVLIGDNNTGKTTILEALNLVLGPDRLNHRPVIDEHDFFKGIYIEPSYDTQQNNDEVISSAGSASEVLQDAKHKIVISAVIIDLTEEQKTTFIDYIEFWDKAENKLFDGPDRASIDKESVTEAIRVTFLGWYDSEEDDFKGASYFTRSLNECDNPDQFSRKHKQICGFLYLRSIRTGSRALSLDHGSLLDIILRLKEIRPKMWENTLSTVAEIDVAGNPELGISPVLESINSALKKYVPKEWGVAPRLKISNLTREDLRKVITAFISTGSGDHVAPFYRQGTGTINMLVLAMLSQIAENKQNVIFAMEEPETAIPPYAQKQIIHEVRKLATQTLFTSHSPYVLEEFKPDETIVLSRNMEGLMKQYNIDLPEGVKPKRYRQEFRTRFCEGLLARRVLLAEGATEYSAFPVACRRLAEISPENYCSLESLGVCVIDAGGQNNIPGMAQLYRELGKQVFVICDKQTDENKNLIKAQAQVLLMHDEVGFEDLVLRGVASSAINRFSKKTDWPPHLREQKETDVNGALKKYFTHAKGNGAISDLLAECNEQEMPEWIRDAALKLKEICKQGSEVLGKAN